MSEVLLCWGIGGSLVEVRKDRPSELPASCNRVVDLVRSPKRQQSQENHSCMDLRTGSDLQRSGTGKDPVPNRKWAIFVWGPSTRVGPAKVRDRGRTRFQIENQEVRATMRKTIPQLSIAISQRRGPRPLRSHVQHTYAMCCFLTAERVVVDRALALDTCLLPVI